MPETTDPLAVTKRYAGTCAGFDTSELLDVLAPNLRFRQVNPGGYRELGSAHAYIGAARWSVIVLVCSNSCARACTGSVVGSQSFTGDGINAVFEPYGAADHHAVRACGAALWLRDAICAPVRQPTLTRRNEGGRAYSFRSGNG